MNLMANSIVVLVAILHIYFMILEMFLWTRPLGLKIFRQSIEMANASSVLAANQGLYNGFLAAGLIWSLFVAEVSFGRQIQIFFLSCVAIAGIYGGWTVHKRIFFVQCLPALIGLIVLGFLR